MGGRLWMRSFALGPSTHAPPRRRRPRLASAAAEDALAHLGRRDGEQRHAREPVRRGVERCALEDLRMSFGRACDVHRACAARGGDTSPSSRAAWLSAVEPEAARRRLAQHVVRGLVVRLSSIPTKGRI